MKKYILGAATLLFVVSCNLPAGGNKSIIPISEDQPRYTDEMAPAEQEPDFLKKKADADAAPAAPAVTTEAEVPAAPEATQQPETKPEEAAEAK